MLNKMLVLLLIIGSTLAADDCPCYLEDSLEYVGTYKWNCFNKGLTSVPGQCYDIQSKNVTELILTNNMIKAVRTIDFVGLFELRSLHVDSNRIEYFDPTALDGIDDLQVFNAAHNPDMEIPIPALRNKHELLEINLVGSKVVNLPDITSSLYLERLDARSCDLSSVSRPLFGDLKSTDFLLNLVGNSIVDVAADILLPIPEFAYINVDSYVTIWAKDYDQKLEVMTKSWVINLDLSVSLKICGTDGQPADTSMC